MPLLLPPPLQTNRNSLLFRLSQTLCIKNGILEGILYFPKKLSTLRFQIYDAVLLNLKRNKHFRDALFLLTTVSKNKSTPIFHRKIGFFCHMNIKKRKSINATKFYSLKSPGLLVQSLKNPKSPNLSIYKPQKMFAFLCLHQFWDIHGTILKLRNIKSSLSILFSY